MIAARPFALSSLSLFVLACSAPQEQPLPPVDDPLEWVDPTVGTGGLGYAYGSAFVGAAAPHGLVKLGPDTRGTAFGTLPFQHYSGYYAEDEFIETFSHMHLHGTGLADYGLIGVMPTAAFDPQKTRSKDYASRFDKSSERASPGLYEVTLSDEDIRAELSASVHAGVHRYTFSEGGAPSLVVDLARSLYNGEVSSASIEFDADGRHFRGQLQSEGQMTAGFGGHALYFAGEVAQPWTALWTWADGAATSGTLLAEGKVVGAAMQFAEGQPVTMTIALSLVSEAGALANLRSEIGDKDLGQVVASTRSLWRQKLERAIVEGGDRDTRTMFYTALYHCFLMPTITSDVDGRYVYGGEEGTMSVGNFVSDLSLWDTYRTLHPLYHLIAPESAADSVRSLEAMAQRGKGYPRWPIATGESGTMLGAPADVVIADALVKLKEVEGFDPDAAFERLLSAATDPSVEESDRGGRNPSAKYIEFGFVPASVGRSVSVALEYATDDFALAQMALALGRGEESEMLMERARSYRQLYDPETETFRPRSESGSFDSAEGYDELFFGDEFAEANAMQMLWAPLHDLAGLRDLLGSDAALVDRLDAFLQAASEELERNPLAELAANAVPRPFYWHGNEPDIHAAYLFGQFGRDDLTQKWLHWVRTSLYANSPAGLPGNDDGGTMSSWLVFTALGFYPVAGSAEYWVGMPLFPRVELETTSGRLVVSAPGLEGSTKAQGVNGVRINGSKLQQASFGHEVFEGNASIDFEVVKEPTAWSAPLPRTGR